MSYADRGLLDLATDATMRGMRLTVHASVDDLLAVAGGFLGAREEDSSLMFGILAFRARDVTKTPPYLASVADVDGVVGVALRTPPHNLLLSEMPDRAIEAMADDLAHRDPALTGVNAPVHVAEAFARAFTQRTGRASKPGLRMRVWSLETLIEPRWAPGALRLATEADLPVATAWFDAFVREAGLQGGETAAEVAKQRIAQQWLYLWDDGGPRSMAVAGGTTPNGRRIGYVYTPGELRSRGYASSCVAALSREILRSGRRFCFLHTDLANPTSNAIYQRLGYRPGGDIQERSFV